jgi:leucyl aminopeptidase
MTLAFADPQTPSRPLHAVRAEDADAFRAGLDPAAARWIAATGWAAAAGEVVLWPGADGLPGGAAVGLGDARARSRARFGVAAAAARLPDGAWHLATPLPPDERDEAALGWLLAGYRFGRYRKARPQGARLVAPEGADAARIEALAAGEALTRDLINTPAADMGPDELEAAARDLATAFGATVTVIRGEALLSERLPMIHAVGRASARAPRLIEMAWGEAGPRLTLVGKGVCFDTGGLDLKPSAGMHLMKKDMGGAATVLGLARTIMATGTPVRLRVLIPAVENMVSGNAMRPRDILTSRKGLTVEVNNTDAEGRLILADALTVAGERGADLVVSMATLTGAARVALGPDLAPFFTDDDAAAAALERAAARVRDPVWRLPFWTPYEAMIEPGIADLDNAPTGGFAGAITAALFLRRFAEPARYIHFDIFGHQPADAPGRPKGGVGQGARAVFAALPELLAL